MTSLSGRRLPGADPDGDLERDRRRAGRLLRGAAGHPGSVGIPLEGLAFIAGVDRILDMARTALNVVGNALAVLVIAKWEHKFDRKKALAYEREVLGKFDKTAQ